MTGSEAQVTKCMSRSMNNINVCVIVRKAETCLSSPVNHKDGLITCLHAETMQKISGK